VVWPALRTIPALTIGGDESENLRAIQVVDGVKEDEWVVSTDLKSATDYAPFALAYAVWRGFFDGLIARNLIDATDAEACLDEVSRHLGPHLIEWPDGSEVTTQGWLMGHPLSWWTLSLAHAAILDIAGLLDRAAVKGDDALVAGPPAKLLLYLELMKGAGFVINESKTFWSRSSGVFCEKLFERGIGRPLCPVPVKRIVAPTPERLANLDREIERLPAAVRGRYREEIWRACGRDGLIDKVRKLGIPLALPRALGGLGIPHRRGLQGALSTARKWATAYLTQVGAQTPIWKTMAEALAYEWTVDGARWATRRLHRKGLLGTTVPATQEVLMRYIGLRAFGLSIAQPSKAAPKGLSHVAKNAARWRKKFLRGSPPHLINPSLWTWSRLEGAIARSALSGIYAVAWMDLLSRHQGITYDTLFS
jgi:hypothetical protein